MTCHKRANYCLYGTPISFFRGMMGIRSVNINVEGIANCEKVVAQIAPGQRLDEECTMKKVAVFAFLFFGISLIAQDFQSYFEEFDVVLYQMQVNVKDKDGNAIKGLKAEDFQLMLDGKQQQIESLEEVSALQLSEQDPSKAIPQQSRRLFVFLFDLRYTTKQGLLMARDSARNFVMGEMLNTDLAAVFVYNPLSGMTMLTNFTGEQEQLMTAIDWLGLDKTQSTIQGPSGYFYGGLVDDFLDQRDGSRLDGLVDQTTPTGNEGLLEAGSERDALDHLIEIMETAQRAEQRIYQREVSTFLKSFTKFADGLRMIRGRKNLVWFSTGFDTRSIVGASVDELQRNQQLVEMGQYHNVSTDQYGVASIQHDSRELVEHLQSSGTVIFAVDTSLAANSAEAQAGIHALNMFAADTGGKVYERYTDLEKPLSRIKELTNDYYVLSFYPNVDIKKGKVGKVRVKIKGNKRAQIYTTRGIMVEPDFNKLTKLEKQIHISEFIGRDQIANGIPMQLSSFQVPVDNDLVKLSLAVEMRGDYFLLGKKRDKTRDIEVHALAISKESNRMFDQAYFRFKLDPENVSGILEKTGVKYFSTLFLKEGEYKLKVVARDMESGKVGSAIRMIKVENKYDTLVGPTLIAKDQWVVVQEPPASSQKRYADKLDFSYPFTVNGANLIPSAMPAVQAGSNNRFFFLLSGDASLKDTPPNLSAMVMDKDGKMMPIPAGSMTADLNYKGGKRHLTNFLLNVDFNGLGLASGESYKLLAQFKTAGGQVLRSMSDFYAE